MEAAAGKETEVEDEVAARDGLAKRELKPGPTNEAHLSIYKTAHSNRPVSFFPFLCLSPMEHIIAWPIYFVCNLTSK
jgi:hypothetical protein